MDVRKDILINCSVGETRMAVTEDGLPVEIKLFRDHQPSYVDSIFLGRITKLSTEFQAAFVDLGNNLSGFLPLKTMPRSPGKKPKDLTALVHEGQRIIVQVTADADQHKSLKLTGRVELLSPAVVFHPFRAGAYVSSRIKDPNKREELKKFGKSLKLDQYGLTFRTDAQHYSLEKLTAVSRHFILHWQNITNDLKNQKCPSILTQPPVPIEQIMRRFAKTDISNVIIDNAAAVRLAVQWANVFSAGLADRINEYTEKETLFSRYEIEDEIEQITAKNVPLASGAWITIEETEALTAIDVNMGSAQVANDQQKQIFKINKEAAREAFRQLRLRSLGGIIIVDFIDMEDKGDQKSLLHYVDELILRDPEPLQRGGISSFGLLELTRRTVQNSLHNLMLEKHVLSKNTECICLDLLRNAQAEAKNNPGLPVTIKVDSNAKKWFENNSIVLDSFLKITGSNLKLDQL